MALKPGQEKCIRTLDSSLVVSAGAGSGKTFTLTRRIVHALSSGAVDDIDRVLAITFTTKAAAELKSRIKGALRAEGMIDQALKVDSAWISTIHGACARILRAHALEVGIDPAFAVLDEASARPLLDASLAEVLAQANDLVAPKGLDALFAEYPARSHGSYGGGSVEDMVRSLALAASANVHGIEAVEVPQAVDAGTLVRRMMELAEGFLGAVEQQKPGKKRDEVAEGTRRAIELSACALAGGVGGGVGAAVGEFDVVALLDGFPVPGGSFGSKEFKDYAREVAQKYAEVMAEARFGAAVPYLRDVRMLASRVLDAYRRRKREVCGLDNNDLLIEAARALAEYPALAAEYAERFQLVMIDEFQDTDQVQVDMIKRMAGPACERLCTVGDAQQSIYRFRGADVSVYHRHVEQTRRENPDGLILLPDNFRSHADVLAFVDRVFEQPHVFGSSFMSLSAARDEARVARPFLSAGPRIDVQMVTRPFRGVSPDEACRVAARGIAQRFVALREAGHAAGDMVLLLGSTTKAGVYAEELRRAGFACVVVKGSVFNRAPEVRLMIRLAQAVANPLDSLALFEVLSSELFSLSADDFLVLTTQRDEETGAYRRRPLLRGLMECAADEMGEGTCAVDAARAAANAGDLAYAHAARASAQGAADVEQWQPSSQLEVAARVMDNVTRAVGRVALSAIMKGIVKDSGWFSRLEQAGAEGQARAANVLKAIRMVEDVERAGAAGPASVAAQFAQRVDIAKEAPGALSAEGGDFVRIMTVHASKGLEFPLVAVAELGQGGASAEKLSLESVNGSIYASLDLGNSVAGLKASSLLAKCTTASFNCEELGEEELGEEVVRKSNAASRRAAIRALRATAEEQEARRLLYVALTRAKEALIVSLSGKRTKDNPSGAKGLAADVQSALCGADCFFPEGKAAFDFGGSRPAAFERIDLEESDESEAAGAEGEAAGCGGEDGSTKGEAAGCEGANRESGGAESAGREGGALGGSAGESAVFADEPTDEPTDGPTNGSTDARFSDEDDASAGKFDVYAVAPLSLRWDVPLRSWRDGVFSYSSISSVGNVAAEGVVVGEDNVAAENGAQEGGEDALRADANPRAGASAGVWPESDGDFARNVSGGVAAGASDDAFDDDDAAWAAIGESLSEEAMATDLGAAFHRLAQLAVLDRVGGALSRPDEQRVSALCKGCGLTDAQRLRLDAALDRWFASSVAARVGAYADVRAEVPFFQAIEDSRASGGEPVYLEGEIDLLATDGTGSGCAFVVDYKTGGRPDEEAACVREKHRLQATCYAYVVLRQGFDEVEAVFVRVEQPDVPQLSTSRSDAPRLDAPQPAAGQPCQPEQPQCVRYRFSSKDLPALEKVILDAYRASLRS